MKMAGVAIATPVLSDSLCKTRPPFKSILMSDANAGGTSAQQIQDQWRFRQMKFPSLSGRRDVDSFRDVTDVQDIAFKKYNDEGNYRPPAPFRSCDNIVDPVSGFVSVCGDVDRKTGRDRILSLVTLNHTPHYSTPKIINSIRVHDKSAPPETQRQSERDAGTPYTWNSRKVIDASLRAKLGGWTSKQDPRLSGIQAAKVDEATHLRDKLAQRFMYTSSTQRSYEHVPWDTILAPRMWAPTTTLEQRPDMISQHSSPRLKRYEPASQPWQADGPAWDRVQTRQGYYKDGPMDIVFCSSDPRVQQIPLYGGSIGAVNLEEKDNRKEKFEPLTVKRNPIPWPTQTSRQQHIPGYTGCTLYRSNTAPEANEMQRPTFSNTTYRELPVNLSQSEFKRDSQMSKMVTTVPPCNPFNKQKKNDIVDTVSS